MEKDEFTICTYWLGPTAPFVSGGIQPLHPSVAVIPSKVAIGVAIASGAGALCTTESVKLGGTARSGRTRRKPSSFSIVRGPVAGPVGKSRTAGERPLTSDLVTTGVMPEPGAARLAGGGCARPIRASKSPTKQRTNARKTRGLEKPDSGFVRIGFNARCRFRPGRSRADRFD